MTLPEILQHETSILIGDGSEVKTAKDINSGSCADFADFIVRYYGEEYNLNIVDSYDFYEDGIWDKSFGVEKSGNVKHVSDDYLRSHPTMTALIEIASADKNYLSSHIFIHSKITGKFYDAEKPDGVTDPFELPIFGRFIDEAKHSLVINGKVGYFNLQSAVDQLADSTKSSAPKMG